MTQTDQTNPSAVEKHVVLLGAGGHAHVLLSLLSMQKRGVLAVYDDNQSLHGKQFGPTGLTISGGLNQVEQHNASEIELVNAIGSAHRPAARQTVYKRAIALGYCFASLRHEQATVACEAVLEPGCQIMAGVTIQAGAKIRANALINTRAIIDHDSIIGEHTHVAPGVTICGGVNVGAGCHIGAGSTVIQGVTIGSGVIVGAGATVLCDVPNGQAVVGTPAKPIGN